MPKGPRTLGTCRYEPRDQFVVAGELKFFNLSYQNRATFRYIVQRNSKLPKILERRRIRMTRKENDLFTPMTNSKNLSRKHVPRACQEYLNVLWDSGGWACASAKRALGPSWRAAGDWDSGRHRRPLGFENAGSCQNRRLWFNKKISDIGIGKRTNRNLI